MAEYLHPSVSSRIVDNSAVYATAAGNTVLYAAIHSAIGRDNAVEFVTTADEFLFKFGNPNLSKYGQTSYNILNWLQSGGTAYVLRVMPDDAKFANSLISIKTTAAESPAKATVLVTAKAQTTNTASKNAMKTVLSGGTAGETPLCFIIPKGRGENYNGYGFRLSLRSDYDNTYNFRTYNLSVTVKDSTGADVVVEGPYIVSFDPEAKDKSRQSIYYANIINKYSQYIEILDNRSAFETVSEFVVGDSGADPQKVDIIFGQERAVTPAETIHANIVWKSSSVETGDPSYNATAANFNNIQYLTEGSEGTWSGGNEESALLVKGYSGVLAPEILDKQQYEIDVLLDGNNEVAVKNAMSDLCSEQRGDCIAILDCSFQGDAQQTIDYRTTNISMSTYFTAIFGQHMNVYDEYNGETITVTSTYFLASMIPSNDDQYGIQWTFVGPRRGVISGFTDINFYPNEPWKEKLYLAQVNYIERDPKKISFATQLTSQASRSALSYINNVRVLLRIRREVEKMMADYRQEFQDNTTYDSMSYNLNNYLQQWVANRACSSISGTVYASDYDKQQSIARVKVELVFTGVIERIAIDLVVNK